MRRYWPSITLVTIILLVLGTFYLQSTFANSSNPSFHFSNISGNEEELESLVIHGTYPNDGMYERVKISKDETVYTSESILRNYLSTHPEINRLQKEYRSFMRGKNHDLHFFFEDEGYVAYADVRVEYNFQGPTDYTFVIDVMDKTVDERIKMDINVPNQDRFSYIWVQDVYVDNNKLQLVTENELLGSNGTEMYVYTFDLEKEKLIADNTLIEYSNNQPNTHTFISIINDQQKLSKETQLVFIKETRSYADEGMETDNHSVHSLYTYDYVTNELKELVLLEEISSLMEPFNLIKAGNIVYVTTNKEDELQVLGYNVDSEEIEVNQTFDLSQTEESYPFIGVVDGKLYIITVDYSENEHGPLKDMKLLIANVDTMEVLYEGRIEFDNNEAVHELYISNIEVK